MQPWLVSGLLAWLALQILGLGAPAPTTTPPRNIDPLPGSEVRLVPVNASCRARVLEEVRQKMLRALRLIAEPRVPAGRAAMVRNLWGKRLKAAARHESFQHSNISSDQALLIRKQNCTQISHRVTTYDLGWESWVIHPEDFFYTDCMGCLCAGGINITSTVEPEACVLELHNSQLQAEQGSCCQVTTSQTPFAFLDGDRGLMLRSVEMNQECRCGP